MMSDMDEAMVVAGIIRAVANGDIAHLRSALHPYLYWVEPDVALRGRGRVLAHLSENRRIAAPTRVEMRDGQVYRWISEPPASATAK
jgi:hypothetical protein